MTALEAKAHELLGQLQPGRLAEVVQLLEAMIEQEPVTDEDLARHQKSLRPDAVWVSMDEVLAEYGLTTADFPLSK